MRYKYLILLALIPLNSFSQTLTDQINAVDGAYREQQSSEEKARQRAISVQKAKAHEQKVKIAEQRAIQEKARKREQNYEDDLRQIELESLKLDLQAKKAVVKRTDEYIDFELKEKSANTDLIQSNADAIRNLSDGKKEQLKSLGKAEETKAKGFWDF